MSFPVNNSNVPNTVLLLEGNETDIDESKINDIHIASRLGLINRVKELVLNKKLINSLNSYGDTPLHLAAAYGQFEVCEFLLANKANSTLKNLAGHTATYYSMGQGHERVTSLLKQTFDNSSQVIEQYSAKYNAQVHQKYPKEAQFSLERYPPIKAINELITSFKAYQGDTKDVSWNPIIKVLEESKTLFTASAEGLADRLLKKSRPLHKSDNYRTLCLPIHVNNHTCYLGFRKSNNDYYLFVSDRKSNGVNPYLFKYKIGSLSKIRHVFKNLKGPGAHKYIEERLLKDLKAETLVKIDFPKPEGENCAFQSVLGIAVLLDYHFNTKGDDCYQKKMALKKIRRWTACDCREKNKDKDPNDFSNTPSKVQKALLPPLIDVEKFKGKKDIRALLKKGEAFSVEKCEGKNSVHKIDVKNLSDTPQAIEIKKVIEFLNSTAVLENGGWVVLPKILLGAACLSYASAKAVEADSQGKQAFKAFVRGFLGSAIVTTVAIYGGAYVIEAIKGTGVGTAGTGSTAATTGTGAATTTTAAMTEAGSTATAAAGGALGAIGDALNPKDKENTSQNNSQVPSSDTHKKIPALEQNTFDNFISKIKPIFDIYSEAGQKVPHPMNTGGAAVMAAGPLAKEILKGLREIPKNPSTLKGLSKGLLSFTEKLQINQKLVPLFEKFISKPSNLSLKDTKLVKSVIEAYNKYSPGRAKLNELIDRNGKIWTRTKERDSINNAYKHWKKHGNDFPDVTNSKQFVEKAYSFFNKTGTLFRTRPNGDILFYDKVTNTLGVFNKNGLPRTIYKPDPLKHKKLTNLEYFYGN
jgi:hypothetical protein